MADIAIKYLHNIDLTNNQLLQAKLENLSASPGLASSYTGRVYFDTNEKRAYYSNGIEWVPMDSKDALDFLDKESLLEIINGVSGNYILPSVGGTGLNGSLATSGQLLIGKSGGGFDLSTISVVSPISITNGSGTIQISHSDADGNKHVPATGTGNNEKVLTAGSTAGSMSWKTPSVKWANVSNKPSSTVVNIDDAVGKRHTQNTDKGTTNSFFQLNYDNDTPANSTGPQLTASSSNLHVKNNSGANFSNVEASSFYANGNFILRDGGNINTIKTSALTANRTLTLANGDTTLVAGTMVATTRTLTLTANDGITSTSSGTAQNLSADRSWTIGLIGQAKALHELSTNGLIARTGTDIVSAREIKGTTNRVSITNGNGVSGNPTIDIASTYIGQTSITTLGTITTGTWQGDVVGVKYGGTGVDASAAANGTLLIGNGAGLTLTTLTGTANQVTVTNASGSITLKTPQNIHTSATPQFARLGLGVAADATANLKLSSGTILSGVANGANAIGFTLTTPSYSTNGAKLLSIKNASSEKFSLDKDGVATLSNVKLTGLDNIPNDILMADASGLIKPTGINADLFATGGRYAIFKRYSYTLNTDSYNVPFDLGVFHQETDALIVYENLVYYLTEGEDYTIDIENDGITLLKEMPEGTRYDFLAIKNVPEAEGETQYSGGYIVDGSITDDKLHTNIKVGGLSALDNDLKTSATSDNFLISSMADAINYVYGNTAQLKNSLTIQINGGSTVGTSKYEFNGGSNVSFNLVGQTDVIELNPTAGQIQIKAGTNLTNAIDIRHTQNTDTGTTSQIFQIQSGSNGVKLKNNSGELHLRNAGDNEYANLRVKDLIVEGEVSTISSNDVNIGDNIITLNAGVSQSSHNTDSGIEIKRLKSDNTTRADAKLIFNETSGRWEASQGPTSNVVSRTVATKFSANLGNGSATSFTINHSLNTRDAVITIRENTSPYAVVYTNVEFLNDNELKVIFAEAPASNQYRITIVG